MFFADDALVAQPPSPAQAERSAWLELVDSLRQDIERLKAERTHAPADSPSDVQSSPDPFAEIRVERASVPETPMAQAAARAVRRKPRRPVEDQWGLFDPEQCGFAALLAKLDEIDSRSHSR
jgi:hypothetical protein